MAAPTVTVSGTALSTDAAGTPIAANLTGGVAGDIAVVFIALDQNIAATIAANGSGWTKRVDVVSSVLAWPSNTTTGVLGASLTTVAVAATVWRTSVEGLGIASTTEVIGGQTYTVFTQFDFQATSGYVSIDTAYVRFVRCKFDATIATVNAQGVVQLAAACTAAIFDDCTFDGGATPRNATIGSVFHSGGVTVRRGNFSNFGDAAVAVYDGTGLASIDISDSYLVSAKGWPPALQPTVLRMSGGATFTATHNTIALEPYGGTDGDMAYISGVCFAVYANDGPFTGAVTIANNRVAGGRWCIYLNQQAYNFAGSVSITANVFDRTAFASIPVKAAITNTLLPSGAGVMFPAGLSWTANTWEDGVVLTLAAAQS